MRFLYLVLPLFLGASAVHCCCFEFRLTASAVLCEKAGSKLPRATMSTGGDQLWSALIHGVKNFSLCLAVYSAFHTHYRKRKGLWEDKLKNYPHAEGQKTTDIDRCFYTMKAKKTVAQRVYLGFIGYICHIKTNINICDIYIYFYIICNRNSHINFTHS